MLAKYRTKKLYCGIITVVTPAEAQSCIRELNGIEVKGNHISVQLVRYLQCFNSVMMLHSICIIISMKEHNGMHNCYDLIRVLLNDELMITLS